MNERKVWFITRPERDPKFHIDALRSLQRATEDFSLKWTGNRDLHKGFEAALAEDEIKRNNISNDGSGGRTWAAMLRTFSYVYLDEEGYLRLTKIGRALLAGENIQENVSKQIVTLQIPNAYFLESGFRPKFESDFQIRPARFLLKLANQEKLGNYITKEEIVFFALTARRDNEMEKVTHDILKYREMGPEDKQETKKRIASEFDHRARSDKGAREYEAAHGDVAHTFMLLCDYTGLADYIRGDALRVPVSKQESTRKALEEIDARYPFSKRYLISLERFAQHAGLDVYSYKASAYGNIKPASNARKTLRKVQQILAKYPLIQDKSEEEVAQVLQTELSIREAEKYASLLVEQQYTGLNDDFVEGYLNEEKPLVFEEKTAEVLRAIGFQTDLNPKPVGYDGGISTEIELAIHIDDESICILDAKLYRAQKFTLTAALASHMGSEYIPIYQGYKGKKVVAYGYIASGDWGGARNMQKITEKAAVALPGSNVQGALITARGLLGFLDQCLEQEIPEEERKRLFISLFKNKGYNTTSEMLREASTI